MIKRLVIIIAMWSMSLTAQNSPYSSGYHFTIPFTTVEYSYQHPTDLNVVVYLSAAQWSSYRVQVPGTWFDQVGVIGPDSIVSLSLPVLFSDTCNGVISPRSIWIDASHPVSAYVVNNPIHPMSYPIGDFNSKISTATTGIPHRHASTYQTAYSPYSILFTPSRLMWFNLGMLAISSNQDSNHVVVTLNGWVTTVCTFPAQFEPAGYQDTLLLNRGDEVSWRLHQAHTASVVESLNDKSFTTRVTSHFLGLICDTCGFHMANPQYKPHDLLIGDEYAGNSYHFGEMLEYASQVYSVTSLADSNGIYLNGTYWRNLDNREFIDTNIIGPLHLTSDSAMHVSVYPVFEMRTPYPYANDLRNRPVYNGTSDDHLITRSVFRTFELPADTGRRYYLSLCMPDSGIAGVSLNDSLLSPGLFSSFGPGTGWSYMSTELPIDNYVLESETPLKGVLYVKNSRTLEVENGIATIERKNNYALNLPQTGPDDGFELRSWCIESESSTAPSWFDQWRDTVCVNEILTISSPQEPPTSWTVSWGDGNSGFIDSNDQGLSHFYPNSGAYWVHVVPDGYFPFSSDSVLVYVVDPSYVDFAVESNAYCEGLHLKLSANSNEPGSFFVDGQLLDGTNELMLPWQMVQDSIQVQYAPDSDYCMDTLTQFIDIPALYSLDALPNVITPNADGINDHLCFEGIPIFQDDCFSVVIRNRWGQEVFRSHKVDDCWQPDNLLSGVYFYEVWIGNTRIYVGNVTLFD